VRSEIIGSPSQSPNVSCDVTCSGRSWMDRRLRHRTSRRPSGRSGFYIQKDPRSALATNLPSAAQ
jgi:hypothetical protein